MSNEQKPVETIATAAEVLEAARNLRKQAQNPNYTSTGSSEVHGDLASGNTTK